MSDWNYLTVHCQPHRNFRGWLTVDLLFFVFKIFIGLIYQTSDTFKNKIKNANDFIFRLYVILIVKAILDFQTIWLFSNLGVFRRILLPIDLRQLYSRF